MKRFLNIFLAVSLFFNLGFAFSGAKASPVPVPLMVVGNETQPFGSSQGYILPIGATSPSDFRRALHRMTFLEALLTGGILGQSIGFGEDVSRTPVESLRAAINSYRSVYINVAYYNPSILDTTNTQIVTNRISEIKAKINITDLRIADLKGLLKAFILGVPYAGGPISGIDSDVDTGDINQVRQALYMARAYKAELGNALRFWAHLIGSNEGDLIKITSINPNLAMAGNVISIDGEGFSNAFAVILEGPYVGKRIEIPANNILSNNRISFTVPSFPDVMGDVPIKISVVDDEAITSFTRTPNFTYQGGSVTCNPPPSCVAPEPGCSYINIPKDANGCVTGCGTLSCPNGDSCKCPSGQVSLSVGGIKRCAVLNTNNISCNRYGNRPVCGCDGTTYQNSCYALINGLKTYANGACN